jgi:hypothetical protein
MFIGFLVRDGDIFAREVPRPGFKVAKLRWLGTRQLGDCGCLNTLIAVCYQTSHSSCISSNRAIASLDAHPIAGLERSLCERLLTG